MQVKEVMTEQVTVVNPDTRVSEIARKMRDEDIGAIPVAENDKMIGMVTDRDIVIRLVSEGRDVNNATAREIMSPKVLYCTDEDDVDDVLENMGEMQIRRLPVVDSEKRLVGVVSLGDLSKAAKRKAGEALKDISQPARH
jgi:CBS domain-containing protein